MYFGEVLFQAFISADNTSSRGLGYGSQAWETTKSGEIMMNLTDTSGADVDLDKIKKNESKNYDGKEGGKRLKVGSNLALHWSAAQTCIRQQPKKV